jgi:hypothetical protein
MNNKEQSYYNIKKVKQFLLDNNAYHNYLDNLYQENHLNNFDDVLDFFSRYMNHIYRFIDFSFTWSFTKEGDTYWLNLHKDFMNNLI